MSFLLQWGALFLIQSAATMSPGPAFAMTLRNATSGDRKAGILTSVGLGLGVGLHVLFVIFGISVLVAGSPLLYDIIKYSGAAYLIFIGAKSVLAKKRSDEAFTPLNTKIKNPSPWRRIQNGLLTNLLNPKAFVFFTAIYAQFITPETPWAISTTFLLTSVFIEMTWFSLVTLFLTTPKIRAAFMKLSHWIDRISGGLLIALGVKLALSKA